MLIRKAAICLLLILCFSSLLLDSCNSPEDKNLIAKEHNQSIDSGLADLERQFLTREFDSAWSLTNHIIERSRKERYPKGVIMAYHHKGEIASKRRQYTDAIEFYDSAILLAANYDKRLLALSYLGIGLQYSAVKLSEKAYENYLNALEIGETTNNLELLRDCYLQVGLELFKQEQFTLSREYFQKSLDCFKRSDTTFPILFAIQEVESNIGLTYYEENKTGGALLYLNKSLQTTLNIPNSIRSNPKFVQFFDSGSLKIAEGVCYGNLARVYRKMGAIDTAISLFKKNIAINSNPGFERHDAAKSAYYLAEIYAERNDITNYELAIHKADSLTETVISPSLAADISLLKSRFAESHGNLDGAYKNLKIYTALNDSLIAGERKDDFLSMFGNYESQRKENSLRVLKRENEVQNIFIVGVSVIIILLIILGLIARTALVNYRTNNRQLVKLNEDISSINSELVMSKQMLEDANTRLTELNSEKSHILRTVAHDLRNPIAGITGITELISSIDHKENKAEIEELTQHIMQACQKAGNIISDLVEHSKDSQVINRNELKKEKTEMTTMIPLIAEHWKTKANEKGIRFNIVLPQVKVYANINRIKFERILENVLSNAIKFTPKQGKIDVELMRAKENLVIKVSDTGIGIPDEMKDMIFDKFTVAGRLGTEGEKSIGLGMSIVKQFVEQHGWKLWLESKVNQGTTVFIEMPAHQG